MARRGAYAKGIAKREEILDAALGVVADLGYGKASVREIAEAAGLSPAGLLHYFGSKEELFVAILQARDERDFRESTDASFLQAFVAVVRHNAAVPGGMHLYARLAADASDPEHPAHAFSVTARHDSRPSASLKSSLHKSAARFAPTSIRAGLCVAHMRSPTVSRTLTCSIPRSTWQPTLSSFCASFARPSNAAARPYAAGRRSAA